MEKKHLKKKLLLGVAGAALIAALVYDKMNKEKVESSDEEDTYNEVESKDE